MVPGRIRAHLCVVSEAPEAVDQLKVLSLRSGETRRMSLLGRWGCRCELSLTPDGRLLAYVDAQGQAS